MDRAAMSLRHRLRQEADLEQRRLTALGLLETFPGTSAGRALPAAPVGVGQRGSVPAVNIYRPPGKGEAIALTGTVAVVGAGSGVAAQMDTIQAQAAFTAVNAPGDDLRLGQSGSWLVEVDVRWTDGYRGGGTVQVTLDGTPVPESWPASGGAWGRWVDQVALQASAGQDIDVFVVPDDGAAHDAQVTLRVTLIEPLRPIARTVSASPAAARLWTSGFDDGTTLSGTATTPTDGATGDTMVMVLVAWSFNDTIPTIDVPTGWTSAAAGSFAGGLSFDDYATAWRICTRQATAGDAAGGGSYGVGATVPSPSSGDILRWRVGGVDLGGGTLGTATVGSARADVSVNPSAAAAGGDYGLVVGVGWNTSNAGSRDITMTIDGPAVTLSPVSSSEKLDVALGTVTGTSSAAVTSTEVNDPSGLAAGAVVILPVSGGAGG